MPLWSCFLLEDLQILTRQVVVIEVREHIFTPAPSGQVLRFNRMHRIPAPQMLNVKM